LCNDAVGRAIALLSRIRRIEDGLGAGKSAEVGKIIMAMGEPGLGRVKACEDIPESNRLRLMKTGHFWRPV
jgi:hypothetical protein